VDLVEHTNDLTARRITIAAAIVAAVALSACGGGTTTTTPTVTTTVTATSSAPPTTPATVNSIQSTELTLQKSLNAYYDSDPGTSVGMPGCVVTTATTAACTAVETAFGATSTLTFALTFSPDGSSFNWVQTSAAPGGS
jgi:hypothetical protein